MRERKLLPETTFFLIYSVHMSTHRRRREAVSFSRARYAEVTVQVPVLDFSATAA
jgi:hypothetical protein